MTNRPTKHQVLMIFDSSTAEIVVANTASTIEFYNKSLVEAHYKLRIESVCKPITPVQMTVAFFSSPLFKSIILAFMSHIMKASFSFDMLVI